MRLFSGDLFISLVAFICFKALNSLMLASPFLFCFGVSLIGRLDRLNFVSFDRVELGLKKRY